MSEVEVNIDHIAKLARLELTSEEHEQFKRQISEILDYVQQLQEVDVEGVEPTAHATHVVNIIRADQAGPTQSLEETMRNAPEVVDGNLIRVPKVIDDGGSA